MINVIIPVYNRIEYTISCINSLKKQDCVKYLKIYLINDGSTDNTKKIVNEKFPDIKIFEGDGSLYWGGAVNYGVSEVLKICNKGDWILLINNDVVLETNSISNLIEQSKKYNRKGIFGALTVSHKDKSLIIKSGTIVKNWFLNFTSHLFLNQNLNDIDNTKTLNVDFLTGRCLLHPVEIFGVVGNYNSKIFPHYGADDEFSMRIKKYGYSAILCPGSIVYLKENQNYDLDKKSFYRKFTYFFFNIKSSANIINKFNLTLRVVPTHAKLTFFFVGIIKSFIIFLKNVKK